MWRDPHAVVVSSRVKIWLCFAVAAGRSTTMYVRHEEDNAMMEELWFLPRLAAGLCQLWRGTALNDGAFFGSLL